jgi:hypothetical protein
MDLVIGKQYVTRSGDIRVLEELLPQAARFLDTKTGIRHLLWPDNLKVYRDVDDDNDIISEFKGGFHKEIHLKEWKDPTSPDYMKVVEFEEESKLKQWQDDLFKIQKELEDIKEVDSISDDDDVFIGTKEDQGKPMFSCLPTGALIELGKVAELGVRKYGAHNYRHDIKVSRFLDAAFRHLLSACEGEDKDPVDGNNHLASAAWNALAALQVLKDNPELDDRYKKS